MRCAAAAVFVLAMATSAFAGRYPELDAEALNTGRGWFHSAPREVSIDTDEKAGTIVVNTSERKLYFLEGDGKAIVYGVGVARDGFEWNATLNVSAKREWPDWTPPAAMLKRRPDIPTHMDGGLDNPLGARALYLGGTEYRIHGSNEPDTIGDAVSSGCIRMLNADVIDLYSRVKVGAKVIVEP